MATNKNDTGVKLPPADRLKIEQSKADIDRGKKMTAALKELGIDTSTLDEKLEWAEKTRESLLRNF